MVWYYCKLQAAPEAGIAVHQCSVPLSKLAELLQQGTWLAIVLVDKSRLTYGSSPTACSTAPWPQLPNLPERVRRWQQQQRQQYAGHYIVLCSYCRQGDLFHVRDPALDETHPTLPAATLEAARKACGTDEDVLLVAVSPPGWSGAPAALRL